MTLSTLSAKTLIPWVLMLNAILMLAIAHRAAQLSWDWRALKMALSSEQIFKGDALDQP